MFNILQIQSSTNFALRCKDCKSVLFTQESISEFISYDPMDFGHLSDFSQQPKLQGEAYYLVLGQQFSYYSSMKTKHEKLLKIDCHPFFKMHLLEIQCKNCNFLLGYEVQTVNQNTLWMQGKLLIDVDKCSIFKDGKEQMPKFLKALKVRLEKRLQTSQVLVEKEHSHGDKRRQMMKRLEKIAENTRKNEMKMKKQTKKDKFDSKKQFQSLQNTNPTMNFTTKGETLHVQNSNFISNIMRNNEVSHRSVSLQERPVTTYQTQEKPYGIIKPSHTQTSKDVEKEQRQLHIVNIALTEEQQVQINSNLETLKQKIQKHSFDLHSKLIIAKILKQLTKMSAQQKYIYNKMPAQMESLMKLLDLFRLICIG